jgi:hypothetical protein
MGNYQATFRRRFMSLVLIGTALARLALAEAGGNRPVRALIPKAVTTPVIDGKLDEWKEAFCTPIEYFNADLQNRPAQIFYQWDDEAFYVGVRTLDEKRFAPDDLFWVGDAVEWYFDTRPDPIDSRLAWGPGAVHCFFTALTRDRVAPRFSLRPGFLDAIPKLGVQLAAHRTDVGLEYEFKLPWSNFPSFHPTVGATLHLDAELSYSDGVSRSFRSFAFGGPLSVDEPANLASVQLVDRLEKKDWQQCGPVMMPIRVDTPWKQNAAPVVQAFVAMPPNRSQDVGRIVFQLVDLNGNSIGQYAADQEEVMQPQGQFVRRSATWSSSVAAPGSYEVYAVVFDRDGDELARIAPRLASINMEQGY